MQSIIHIWDSNYTALDVQFEAALKKYRTKNDPDELKNLIKYMEESSDAEDDRTKKKKLDSVNLAAKKHQEKYAEWTKETKKKLGYK